MYDATALKNLMVNENGFAFDPSTGHTYNLSLSALELVHLLNNGADEQELLQSIKDTYEVDEHRAVRDLDAFLATLGQYGLLKPATEEGEENS